MKELLKKLSERMREGKDTVMVSVVASHGSVPRGAGARMLVFPEGGFEGTIGGGLVEFESQRLAKELLETKQSHFKNFTLDAEKVAGLGMVCGGDVSVCFQYAAGHDEKLEKVANMALEMLDADEDAWLITELTGDEARAFAVCSASTGLVGLEMADASPLLTPSPVMLTLDGRRFYSEPLCARGRAFVFGGGHVSAELVPVLAHVGFRCSVYDDRPEFANEARFPSAERVVCDDFSRAFEHFSVTDRDFVVIMTRGHAGDYELMAAALGTRARYIGVIGSRRKAEIAMKKLREAGFGEENMSRVVSPVGLSIGAETPAEIAISIAAQMIQARSGGRHHG